MVLLQDNEAMRHFIVNHTEPNTTVAQWKEAIKTSFGLTYYNDMLLEILEQYATFYWVYELQEQYMYGSSRLGSVQRNLPLVQQVLNSDSLLYHDYSQDSIRYFYRGQKRYELSNHLGNVLAVITDRKIEHCDAGDLSYYVAHSLCRLGGMVSVTDYYPFGSFSNAALAVEIKERSWSVSSYRFGFNGKEKDPEGMGGGGATYDYGFRFYNPQLGKFLSVDPLFKSYPWYTPYQFAGNMPIAAIDLDGLEEFVVIRWYDNGNYIGTTVTFLPNMKGVRKYDNNSVMTIDREYSSDQFEFIRKGKIFSTHRRTKIISGLNNEAKKILFGTPRSETFDDDFKNETEEKAGEGVSKNFFFSPFGKTTKGLFFKASPSAWLKDKGKIILYDFNDKNSFRIDGKILNNYKRFLANNPDYDIVVTGHTDKVGSEEYNQELGLQRAQDVKDYLVKNGINPDRIKIDSRGEQEAQQNENSSNEERQSDRKVEIKWEARQKK